MQALPSLAFRSSALSCALVFATAASAQFPEPVPAPRELAEAFDLQRAHVQDLTLPMQAGQDLRVPVTLGSRKAVLAIHPHDLRSPRYKLLVDDGKGNLTQVPTPPSVTYQGVVAGQDGSTVAVSLIEGQLRGFVDMEGESWAIEPASDGMPGLPRAAHVIYRQEDITPSDARCGVENNHTADFGAARGTEDGGPTLDVCEIALDLDFEYYTKSGSSIVNAENEAISILSGVDTIYKRDTQITYTLTQIIVRAGGNPASYDNATSSGALLSAFRSHWNANHGAVVRDVAHLLTGKNPWSSTIGIANPGVICIKSSAYALSHSKNTGGLLFKRGLTAHEVGHNWNAGHCDGNPNGCVIMCSSLGGCGAVPNIFAPPSITAITNFAATRGCLTTIAQDPPTLSSLSISTTSNYNSIGTVNVTATGLELDSVTSVTVGSQAVNISNQTPTSLTFQIQNGHEIGAHNVVANNNVGPSNPLPFSVTPTHPSVLLAPPLHQSGITVSYPVYTDANWNALYCFSALNGTTALPGIITFEIGGGFLGQIFAVITLTADSGGFIDLPVPMPSGLPTPFTLYWECLTYDPAVPLGLQAPLETSNGAGVFTLF